MSFNRKSRLRDLQMRPDRGVGNTSGISGVLSQLFRQMVWDMNVSGSKWSEYLNQYAKGEAVHHQNKRDIASIRGNLNKEFSRINMTWKVFCKAMMFLRVRRFKIIILAEMETGEVKEYSSIVDSSLVLKNRGIDLPEGVEEAAMQTSKLEYTKVVVDEGGLKENE